MDLIAIFVCVACALLMYKLVCVMISVMKLVFGKLWNLRRRTTISAAADAKEIRELIEYLKNDLAYTDPDASGEDTLLLTARIFARMIAVTERKKEPNPLRRYNKIVYEVLDSLPADAKSTFAKHMFPQHTILDLVLQHLFNLTA